MSSFLDRIHRACNESKHSEIIKLLSLSSPPKNEPFVVEAFNRRCSICINMFLWQINFDEKIIRNSSCFSSKRRNNLLLRIEFFAENQEYINTLLDAFREERFEMLKSLFCSKVVARNFVYQLALERALKEDKSDALLLLLQWEKERLAKNSNAHIKLSTKVEPHRHVVSKLCAFMLRFDLPHTEPQQKKIKLDEKVPFISEIYEHLKLDETVIAKKWFERKGPTSKKFFKDNLESKWLQIYYEDLKSYRAYFLLNYPSLINEPEMESDSNGQSVLEYTLSTPDVGISIEILRNFVKAKPSVVNWVKEGTGDSMLHVYVKTRADSPEIVQFMIEELGLDPFKENKAKENALESLIRAKWSENRIYEPFEDTKEILEYLESKSPLDGAEFIQKFSIFTGFKMVYRAAYDKNPNQQFFLQYAMEKFYGPEINEDYPLIERFKKFYGPNLHEKSTHIGYNDNNFYDVVALLHSDFDKNDSNQLNSNFDFEDFIKESVIDSMGLFLPFISGQKYDLIAKLYDENDEDLKLFFEIIMKNEKIFARYCGDYQTYPKILSCLPPYDEYSKEGFKKEHIERMVRVFNELIAEKNNACDTIQEAIEAWPVENITTDMFNFKDDNYYLLMLNFDIAPEWKPLKEHKRLMKKIVRSGLFSALYSFTCDWEFTLRDEDDLSDHHYQKLKMFLGKSELFLPGSLYPQKGDVFSLKHLCRLEIRQMFIKDAPGDIATNVEMIESLGLPKKMENYIRYLPEC